MSAPQLPARLPLSFLHEWERPDTSVMGIVGDFDTADMLARVRACLGEQAWPTPGSPPPRDPREELPPQQHLGTVTLINQPGLTQVGGGLGSEEGLAGAWGKEGGVGFRAWMGPGRV